jgi:hypothetical protein
MDLGRLLLAHSGCSHNDDYGTFAIEVPGKAVLARTSAHRANSIAAGVLGKSQGKLRRRKYMAILAHNSNSGNPLGLQTRRCLKGL